MTGTIVNAAAIALASCIGVLLRRGLPKRLEQSVMAMLGLAVWVVGLTGMLECMVTVDAEGALHASGSILLLFSLVLGIMAGELLRIDDRLNGIGKKIEEKLQISGFAKGFITASIIFCVGAMAIIGSLQDGMYGDSDVLFTKAALDFVCSLVLASTLGVGVAFSALSVLAYQGAISLLAGVLQPLLSDLLLSQICMVGYVVVLCIGMNFLGITRIRVANMLPALLVPVVWALLRAAAVLLGFSWAVSGAV